VEAIAIVTILALMQGFLFAVQVGQARVKHRILAPAISGNAEFERSFRVHQNTLEQLVIFIPALWIFGSYLNELAGAVLGMLFIVGRFVYRASYLKDPATRSLGFGLGALATAILLVGGLTGAVMKMLQG
jgi:glutathione S-transferase